MADYTVAFSELNSLLQSLPANTVDTPYSIVISDLSMSYMDNSFSYTATEGTLRYILQQNPNKYVDLSEINLYDLYTPNNDCFGLYYSFYGCTSIVHGPISPNQMCCTYQDCTNLKTIRVRFQDPVDPDDDYNSSREEFGTMAGSSEDFAFLYCPNLTNIYVDTQAQKDSILSYYNYAKNYDDEVRDYSTIVKVSPETVPPEPEPYPDPSTFEKGNIQSSKSLENSPYTLSATQTISADIDRKFILNSSSATITLADSNVIGVTISIMPIQSGAQVSYKNSSGVSSTETATAFKLLNFIWNGTGYILEKTISLSGTDDNGTEFSYDVINRV